MRFGCGRSTSFHHDLNIAEQPGLQSPYFLSTGQRAYTDERSVTAVHTVGAYFRTAWGLPRLIGTCVTAVVLFIL